MKTILVISQKGGSGKTTLACNLAVAFNQENNVVLVDTDPQGSTLDWGEDRNHTKTEDSLVVDFLDTQNITKSLAAFKKDCADFVIIDTPPTLSDLQEKLVAVADYIVVPLMATKSNFTTIEPLLEIVEKTNIPYGFVISNANTNTKMYQEGKDILSQYGKIISTLKHTTQMQEAELNGLSIIETNKNHFNTESIFKTQKSIEKTFKLKG